MFTFFREILIRVLVQRINEINGIYFVVFFYCVNVVVVVDGGGGGLTIAR